MDELVSFSALAASVSTLNFSSLKMLPFMFSTDLSTWVFACLPEHTDLSSPFLALTRIINVKKN